MTLKSANVVEILGDCEDYLWNAQIIPLFDELFTYARLIHSPQGAWRLFY